jgi:hypothetical protein
MSDFEAARDKLIMGTGTSIGDHAARPEEALRQHGFTTRPGHTSDDRR